MKENNCLVIGAKDISTRFNITMKQFYIFLKLGLPVRKINGRWYGHEDNINDFFRAITKPGKPIIVSDQGWEYGLDRDEEC